MNGILTLRMVLERMDAPAPRKMGLNRIQEQKD
jgi:hypothetical protein